jgi:putative CocE/NonD family hydrolase
MPGMGPFEVMVERDVMVTVRDGTRLAVDIHRPAVRGVVVDDPAPVILHRTPYGRSTAHQDYATTFASHGYVAVVQDVRGTFGSEGTFSFVTSEAHDGADTMRWIVDQPWSDGRTGTWGNSYAGFTQLAAATQTPPGLVSMVPYQCASDAWASSVRHQGAFELRWMAWAFWHSATNLREDLRSRPWLEAALNLGAPSCSDWLSRLPLRRGASQLALRPDYEDWLLRLIEHSDGDGPWEDPGMAPVRHLESFPDCSVLLLGSWYDSYTRGTIELYEAMRSYEHLEVRLVMGPWTHGASSAETTRSGDVEFGPSAAIRDLRALHVDWFDRTLRGGGPPHDPSARLFVMGGGSGLRTTTGHLAHGGGWRTLECWPPPGSERVAWYLHGDGTLDPVPPGHAVDAEAASTTYCFDPDDPVPTIGGNVSSFADLAPMPAGVVSTEHGGGSIRIADLLAPGGFDQRERPGIFGCRPPYLPLASRPDVLVFRTEPLTDDLEVIGRVTAVLHVSVDALDTDVTAKLIDEYPASPSTPLGYALNLSDSIVRLRYREGRTATSLQPGAVVEVTVNLYPTANLFRAGHRIRLDVSSSNFPRFDVNPNTGAALGTERHRRPALVTLHHAATYPSRLELECVMSQASRD